MKELDEALRRGTIILKGILGHYENCGVDCPRCKVATEKAKQILNLKGDNWKIAIINPQKSSTFNKQYKLVIWEGREESCNLTAITADGESRWLNLLLKCTLSMGAMSM